MRNIEAKFRIASYDRGWYAIKHIAGLPIEYLRQTDYYYQPPPERIILRTTRIIDPAPNFYYEQICYQRSPRDKLQFSEYHKSRIAHSARFSIAQPSVDLEKFSFGRTETGVSKYRKVFILDQTRIHLDLVDYLGCFIEIIRPLQDEGTEELAQESFWYIVRKIGLSPNNIVEESYIDLLKQQTQ